MLLVSLALTLPLFLTPQQGDFQIQCGDQKQPLEMLLQAGEGVIRCSNGATVIYQNMRIESDWMEYDPKTKEVTAGDKVHFQREQEDLRGGKLSLNLDTRSGT